MPHQVKVIINNMTSNGGYLICHLLQSFQELNSGTKELMWLLKQCEGGISHIHKMLTLSYMRASTQNYLYCQNHWFLELEVKRKEHKSTTCLFLTFWQLNHFTQIFMLINMTSASNMRYIPCIKIMEHNLIPDHAIT